MPRIRSIHPDACKSEKLAAASAEAERCYWRLLPHCDDDGRAEDDPRLLRAAMFPLNDEITAPLVDQWLSDLARGGLLVRYTARGVRVLSVTRWHDYQHPQKKQASKLPAPSRRTTRGLRDQDGMFPVGVEPGEGEGVGDGVPSGGADGAAPDPRVQVLVAGFVEDYRAERQGKDPDRAWRGIAGKAIKRALANNETPDDIAKCLGVIAHEGKTPSTLPHVLADYHAGRPRRP